MMQLQNFRLLGTILLLLLYYCQALAQPTYTVIKVSGKVVSSLMNREVKTGDNLKPNDKLRFDSKESYLHVVNAEGTRTIRNIPDNSPREFLQLMKSLPNPEVKAKTSRGGSLTSFNRIKAQLHGDTLLILGNGYISIDTNDITLRDPAIIIASYTSKGEKKSIGINDMTGFSLTKQALFGDAIENSWPKITVMYHQDRKELYFSVTEMLGAFVPKYSNESQLKMEVTQIVTALKSANLSSSNIQDEIIQYLSIEYAQPIHENLNWWLTSNKLLN